MKKLFVLLLIGLAAYFIWPTRYLTYAPGEGPHAHEIDAPTRVDRLTREVSAQAPSGEWRSLDYALQAPAFRRPAVDPNATRRPSARHHQEVADQQRQSVERTQQAVDAATQQNP